MANMMDCGYGKTDLCLKNNTSMKWVKHEANMFFIALYPVIYLTDHNEIATATAIDSTSFQAPKKWVSMALCWGNRIKLYHKSQFPYALAGQLSTKLWLQVVNVSVIFHIVVCDEAQVYDNYTLNEYVQDLEVSGVIVKILKIQNCDKCVLEAQLIRLLAYLSYAEVSIVLRF